VKSYQVVKGERICETKTAGQATSTKARDEEHGVERKRAAPKRVMEARFLESGEVALAGLGVGGLSDWGPDVSPEGEADDVNGSGGEEGALSEEPDEGEEEPDEGEGERENEERASQEPTSGEEEGAPDDTPLPSPRAGRGGASSASPGAASSAPPTGLTRQSPGEKKPAVVAVASRAASLQTPTRSKAPIAVSSGLHRRRTCQLLKSWTALLW
jgi:hypothetical protein